MFGYKRAPKRENETTCCNHIDQINTFKASISPNVYERIDLEDLFILPGCIRVVKRGDKVVYSDTPNCEIVEYTEVVELPRVEKRVETENYIVEKLSTGDVYVQYKSIFEALDKAFSNYDVGSLFLLTGPPRTGKSYAAEYFAKKWGREIKIMPPSFILSKWLGDTEKRISRLFQWVRSTNGVLVFDEGETFVMRRGRVLRRVLYLRCCSTSGFYYEFLICYCPHLYRGLYSDSLLLTWV